MNLLPYFPEPLEVTGNVAKSRYRVILFFIRSISILHYGTIFLIWSLSVFLAPSFTFPSAGWICLCSLISLSLSRTFFTGPLEAFISVIVFIPYIGSLGLYFYTLHLGGYPIWILGIATTNAFLYTFLCREDFSFFGQFLFAFLATSIFIFAAFWLKILVPEQIRIAFILTAIYLFYYVYDLASILKRRRPNEILMAAFDLHRDVLNFLSYSIRVVQHWRKFRI